MTARLQDGIPNTRLTLSAASEDQWQADRRRALVDRRHTADRELRLPLTQAAPRRTDWYRVAALLIVAGAAVLTAIGLWALGVYVLTTF